MGTERTGATGKCAKDSECEERKVEERQMGPERGDKRQRETEIKKQQHKTEKSE